MVRPGRDQLAGCVQVDETYVGGRKKPGKRGRGAVGAIRAWALLDTLLSSGLWASEVAALRVGDCLLGYGQASLVVRQGKGGKQRDVFFIRQELKAHLKAFLTWKRDRGEDVSDLAPVFTGQRGPLTRENGTGHHLRPNPLILPRHDFILGSTTEQGTRQIHQVLPHPAHPDLRLDPSDFPCCGPHVALQAGSTSETQLRGGV